MGDFVFIPKVIPHRLQVGRSGGKMLVISPTGLENYFKKVASAIQTGKITWELEKIKLAVMANSFWINRQRPYKRQECIT